MSHGKSDAGAVQGTHNLTRFFTEQRQLAWVLLLGTVVWGVFGYRTMPQRKDPEIPPTTAMAVCSWPGVSAEKIEQLVTRKMEAAIAGNPRIEKLTSTTRTSLAVVQFELVKTVSDTGKEFDDIRQRLDDVAGSLPSGTHLQFVKDFGDTATLLLTVASPRVRAVEAELQARTVLRALARSRAGAAAPDQVALLMGLPRRGDPAQVRGLAGQFAGFAAGRGLLRSWRLVEGAGFIAVDATSGASDAQLLGSVREFVAERLRASEFHPDNWGPVIVRDPAHLEAQLETAMADKYSDRELDDFTEQLQRNLERLPTVGKVVRAGVQEERVLLSYSQERLASYGVRPDGILQALSARNVVPRGGVVEVGGRQLRVSPSGEYADPTEIGATLVPVAGGKGAMYLRDLVEVSRGYENPPSFLNDYLRRGADGRWERTRAVTLSVQMRSGQQIAQFSREVDRTLADVRALLPEDLIIARTSDQPRQVREAVSLFMGSLYEAIALVVLVSLLGFWEWRSAALMALSIPITLAMTFGFLRLLGIDLQQVSIASLIIALGLLVDDPVVAGDAVKRELAAGHPRGVAAWLGPTKLATAILYATITNIVAYLPFELLSGNTGKFLYSLPIVVGSSLVASRIVSMTFIPLLAYYLLRPRAEPTIEERRSRGLGKHYYRIGSWAIAHRWQVMAGSLSILALGVVLGKQLKTQFFPKDRQYLAWVDVRLREDAPLSSTRAAAAQVEQIITEVAEEFGREHAEGGKPKQVLQSLTTFVGGGGPRFWSSAAPEPRQPNYAQVILLVSDKDETAALLPRLQAALSARVAGALIDVQQLETGEPVGVPVSIRISGEEIPTLRRLTQEAMAIFRSQPSAFRLRDDWGAEGLAVKLETDSDRAAQSGVTHADVANSSTAALSGAVVALLREGDRLIPVLARMRMEERARLEDLRNLYVYSSSGQVKVPLGQVSTVDYQLQTERIARRNQFRTVTIGVFPAPGMLSSEVLDPLLPRLAEFEKRLPPGYRLEIGGEAEKQRSGFAELAMVMGISIALIFLALVFQFKHAVKPFLVFAAIPYGITGAVAALWVMGAPFGFMAFLGIASLVGVIVSHVIVLFDFVEEAHAEGKPLQEALLDAGIVRLRPVMITVGATVIALFPLAFHGGPLWEPLCYAQIGGLAVATFVTLLLVPTLYAIFVLDLKLIRWGPDEAVAAPRGESRLA